MPMRLTCAALMALTLSACATSHPDQRGAGTERDAQAAENPRLTEIRGVLFGMTHEDVVSVLGGNFITHHLGTFMVRSFPYVDNGITKYHWVGYDEGRVTAVGTGEDQPYFVQ